MHTRLHWVRLRLAQAIQDVESPKTYTISWLWPWCVMQRQQDLSVAAAHEANGFGCLGGRAAQKPLTTLAAVLDPGATRLQPKSRSAAAGRLLGGSLGHGDRQTAGDRDRDRDRDRETNRQADRDRTIAPPVMAIRLPTGP